MQKLVDYPKDIRPFCFIHSKNVLSTSKEAKVLRSVCNAKRLDEIVVTLKVFMKIVSIRMNFNLSHETEERYAPRTPRSQRSRTW